MQPRLAVLIDAENVPPGLWTEIKKGIGEKGAMICCRLFGDFSDNRLSKWIVIGRQEALQPVMQLSGANASDIAITIAAMDILHSTKLEGICLVSSDSDFTPLALRLRAAGLRVHGFGESKTPPSLRSACTDFHVLGEITAPVQKQVEAKPKVAMPQQRQLAKPQPKSQPVKPKPQMQVAKPKAPSPAPRAQVAPAH